MKTTKIYKHQNKDGTFTYTNEEGAVVINKSKKDYEYFTVAYNAKGLSFGSFATCSKELENYRTHASQNLEWMQKHITYWTNKYGQEDAEKQMRKSIEWVEEAKAAKVTLVHLL